MCCATGSSTASNALHPLADKLLRQQQTNIRQTVEAISQQGYPLPKDDVLALSKRPLYSSPTCWSIWCGGRDTARGTFAGAAAGRVRFTADHGGYC